MTAANGLALQVTEQTDATVVRILSPKILNDQAFEAMMEELFTLTIRLKPRLLRLDFGAVVYLQSSALGKVIALNSRVTAGGGRLILFDVHPSVYKVIAATKLNQILTVEKAPEENEDLTP